MSDERLRELEREAAGGDPIAVERYLVEKIRVSPDLTTKLVRRVIRLSSVDTGSKYSNSLARAVRITRSFLAFLNQDVPTKNTGPGELQIEGQDPTRPGGPRGGTVNISGGRSDGVGPLLEVAPTNAQLHAMIQALMQRVAALEGA